VDALARALGKSGARVRRLGVQLPAPPRLDRVVTEDSQRELQHGVQATLRPYQAAGVRWLLGLYAAQLGGVLADDMGLGKTLQTITLLAVLHARGALDQPSLIVVPTSLIQNWQRELQRFAPQLSVLVWHGSTRREARAGGAPDPFRAQLIVTSYALLVREQERWQAQPFQYLILDEAQNIKNPRSAVRTAARSLTARHRLCLSGTPVENHLGDMWSLFDFLMPGLLGSAAEFQTRYRVPIEDERNEEQLATLRRLVGPFILRRTKEQVAKDLPPKSNLVRAVELGEAQRRLYESIRIAAHADVRRMVQTKGIAGSTLTILDALMKLRQVCCDPRLVQVQAAQRVSESAKLTFLFRLLVGELGQSRRILVFSQFTSMLSLIADGLTARGIDFALLTGATQDRARQVDSFQRGSVDVFLISLKAGGTGLNLTSADTVIHYDPWWNPAAQAQATDRAHRIGQTRPVFVHQLIVAGSVEERMLELQHKKRELAESFIGSADAERATLSAEQLGAIGADDISSLFAPLGQAEA
jgi:SNF2 family DNA or RNA helicase